MAEIFQLFLLCMLVYAVFLIFFLFGSVIITHSAPPIRFSSFFLNIHTAMFLLLTAQQRANVIIKGFTEMCP